MNNKLQQKTINVKIVVEKNITGTQKADWVYYDLVYSDGKNLFTKTIQSPNQEKINASAMITVNSDSYWFTEPTEKILCIDNYTNFENVKNKILSTAVFEPTRIKNYSCCRGNTKFTEEELIESIVNKESIFRVSDNSFILAKLSYITKRIDKRIEPITELTLTIEELKEEEKK